MLSLDPLKSSTPTSTITRKREPLLHVVTINVEIMKKLKLQLTMIT